MSLRHALSFSLLFFLEAASGCGQVPPQDDSGNDTAQEALTAPAPTYSWPLPARGWFTDKFDLPLPFVPELPYSGSEDLHQLNGFGTPASPEWWSYNYLLWLDGSPRITRDSLERDLLAYYKGLCNYFGPPAVTCNPSGFSSKVVRLGEVKLGGRSTDVFAADITGYDPFFTGQPIALHMLISSFQCPRAGHRAVLLSASPQPIGQGPWPALLENALQFRCQ
jgi:hypothetical protein